MISICLIIAVHCLTYLGILKYQSIAYCAVICYCQDIAHFQALNLYANDILNTCILADDAFIPHACPLQGNGRLPG